VNKSIRGYIPKITDLLGFDTWKIGTVNPPRDFPDYVSVGNYHLIHTVDTTNRSTYDKKTKKFSRLPYPVLIARWELVDMINCCGILVSTDAFVAPDYRDKGLGNLLNLLRIDMAKYLGYSLLLCTDIQQNTHQRKILKKNNWKDIYAFVNKNTESTINISVVDLQ